MYASNMPPTHSQSAETWRSHLSVQHWNVGNVGHTCITHIFVFVGDNDSSRARPFLLTSGTTVIPAGHGHFS